MEKLEKYYPLKRQSRLKQTKILISFYSRPGRQTIHMEYQDLFSLKNKNFRMSSASNFAWRFKGYVGTPSYLELRYLS